MACANLSRSGGGLATAVIPLAEALGRDGRHRPELFSFFLPENSPSVATAVLSNMGPGLFLMPSGFTRTLTARGTELVHLHGLWTGLTPAAKSACQRLGIPFVLSPHGMLDEWALNHSRWKKRLVMSLFERSALKYAACIHALNQAEAASIRSLGFQQPIVIIPNGVVLPTHMPARLPETFGKDARRVLLFLGRLHPKKGIDRLLAAWHNLKKFAPDITASWRIVVAGWDEGDHLRELTNSTAELGLKDDVTFVGPLFGEDKQAGLANAGAFVLPSFSEGQPVTVLEAWSYSLPVLMTRACNMPEGFRVGAASEITNDPQGLAYQLAEQLADTVALQQLGRLGRSFVERAFSWSSVATRWSSTYDWLLGYGPKPDDVYD